MKKEILETINNYKMINAGDKVIVGLSGGADSVCLLLCLNELKEQLEISLSAVHINHCLRGEESDSDEAFCRQLCEKQGIKLYVDRIDVKKEISGKGLSLEEGARKLRYKSFLHYAKGGKIATAHTLDDVAETLIFNITRGCSTSGIASIPAKRDNIIRPLINISRESVENYLAHKKQRFVVDSTNLSDDYTRNKIRHNVIPVLKEINPSFLQSVKRLKENATEKNDYFSSEIAKLKLGEISASKLRCYPKAIVYEYISSLCYDKLDINLEYKHIDDCYKALQNGGKCQLPKSNYFSIENDKIILGKKKTLPEEKFMLSFEGNFKTPYNSYNVEIIEYNNFKKLQNVNSLFLNNVLDYDKICVDPIIRNKCSGDKVRLKNRNCTKILKSLFNELKIPVEKRATLALLEVNGKIAWVESVGVAEGFYPTKNTKKVIIISPEVDCY